MTVLLLLAVVLVSVFSASQNRGDPIADGWVLGGLAWVTCVAYLPVWSATFVYEDPHWLPIWQGGAFPSFAWLAYLPWLGATWMGGGAPWAYHGLALLVHLMNGLLLYAVLRDRIDAAVLIVGLFWVMPINVEAVAYLSGAREAFVAFWTLLAIWIADQESGTWFRLAGVLLCLGVSIATKSSGIVAVVLVPLAVWWLHPSFLRRTAPVLVVGSLLLATPAVRWVVQLEAAEHNLRIGWHGLLTNGSLTAAALLRYLWPFGLSLDHDWLAVPTLTRAAAAVLLSLWCGVVAWQGKRLPLLAAATVWALLAIAPRFIVQQAEILNEHQVYLAYLGVWVCLGVWVQSIDVPSFLLAKDSQHVW